MSIVNQPRKIRTQLLSAAAVAASANTLPLVNFQLGGYRELVVTLNVTAATHTDETYDIYLTSSDGVSEWDIVHFTQIATGVTTTPTRYTARVLAERLAEVTTAAPGVAAEPTATLQTDTAGSANGAKTLGVGKVRHGPFGDWLGVWVVVAGSAPRITFTVDLSAAA